MSRRAGQPIALVQRADRWSSVCGQPRLDQPVFLDREAMADQHLTQDVIGTVDLEADGFEPGLTGVREPALDDMGNPVGSCVGHDDRVERYPVAPVGCDHRSFRATEVIEPEELREVVGRARGAPPPLQIGGFIQPCRGVSAADSLQERRRSFQVVETDPMLFSQRSHLSNLRRRHGPNTPGCGVGRWCGWVTDVSRS